MFLSQDYGLLQSPASDPYLEDVWYVCVVMLMLLTVELL